MTRIIVFVLLITGIHANSQNPVKWTFTAKKIADRTYEIHLTAALPSPWSIYSQSTPDGGPVATSIRFSKNPLLILDGKIKEIGILKKKHEKVFGVDVLYYNSNVEFVQVIKLKNNIKTNISGIIEFMVCDEEQCLPPEEVAFSIKLQ